MTIPFLISNITIVLLFVGHLYYGDKEIKRIEPRDSSVNQGLWTLARVAWHWVSWDLLFIAILMALVNFTGVFSGNEAIVQKIIAVYIIGVSVSWTITTCISRPCEKKFVMFIPAALIILSIGILAFF